MPKLTNKSKRSPRYKYKRRKNKKSNRKTNKLRKVKSLKRNYSKKKKTRTINGGAKKGERAAGGTGTPASSELAAQDAKLAEELAKRFAEEYKAAKLAEEQASEQAAQELSKSFAEEEAEEPSPEPTPVAEPSPAAGAAEPSVEVLEGQYEFKHKVTGDSEQVNTLVFCHGNLEAEDNTWKLDSEPQDHVFLKEIGNKMAQVLKQNIVYQTADINPVNEPDLNPEDITSSMPNTLYMSCPLTTMSMVDTIVELKEGESKLSTNILTELYMNAFKISNEHILLNKLRGKIFGAFQNFFELIQNSETTDNGIKFFDINTKSYKDSWKDLVDFLSHPAIEIIKNKDFYISKAKILIYIPEKTYNFFAKHPLNGNITKAQKIVPEKYGIFFY